jgi:hypothetical protein
MVGQLCRRPSAFGLPPASGLRMRSYWSSRSAHRKRWVPFVVGCRACSWRTRPDRYDRLTPRCPCWWWPTATSDLPALSRGGRARLRGGAVLAGRPTSTARARVRLMHPPAAQKPACSDASTRAWVPELAVEQHLQPTRRFCDEPVLRGMHRAADQPVAASNRSDGLPRHEQQCGRGVRVGGGRRTARSSAAQVDQPGDRTGRVALRGALPGRHLGRAWLRAHNLPARALGTPLAG